MQDRSLEQALVETQAKRARQEMYQGRVISVCTDTMEYDNVLRRWDVVVHPGAVVIVPVTVDQQLLLVKQWRRVVEQVLLEFPAGTLEVHEDPLACAQRELQEETGYRSDRILSLGGFYSAPGFCTEFLHLFVAFDLKEAPLQADADEAIDVVPMTREHLFHLIQTDQVQDAKTIAGLYRYEQWLKTSKAL